MMTLIFFLLGILTGLILAFIIGQFALKKGHREWEDKLVGFWEKRSEVDDRMIELWKEKNEQEQQMVEALWEVRKAIIDLRR